jgi:hypothetical protein
LSLLVGKSLDREGVGLREEREFLEDVNVNSQSWYCVWLFAYFRCSR